MKTGILFGLLLCSFVCFAANTSAYIHDIESLLNSLESKDPTRLPLTMKLADALFNEALDLSGHSPTTPAEEKAISRDRARAIALYKDSLSGLGGSFKAPTGATVSKIQFQLARMYADTGATVQAEQLYSILSKQEALPDVQRESLLRIAEILENHTNKADLEQAKADYQKALTLCTGQDVCSYCHYRLGWVYQRLSKMNEAIAEVEQSLWDSKGHVREESLRDLVSFFGSRGDDGKDSLSQVEKLSAKLNRPELITDLSESYFAQGNRSAGTYVLNFSNGKNPNLKSTIRLMEEYYGFRDWQKFDAALDAAEDMAKKTTTIDKAANAKPAGSMDPENEKILRRLTVQLDGERMTEAQRSEEFRGTVMLYLQLYPNNAERTHMIDGWIASEKDDVKKSAQLKIWIAQDTEFKLTSEVARLRRLRAAVAQKNKDYAVVTEEMSALQPMTGSAAEKREVQYQIAYSQYQNKNYEQALPAFVALATMPVNGTAAPDKWAVQSQNLALDILGQKKDYRGMLSQVQKWTKNPHFKTWVSTGGFSKELSDLISIETNAEFELASAQAQNPAGDKAEALNIFLKDCEQKVLTPKSCTNAQVLAEKTGNEAALLRVLTAQNKKDELASEFEASGEFAKAAEMLEKQQKEKVLPVRTSLKIALLYELGGSNPNRDRVLRAMTANLMGKKSLGEEEDLILQTLRDANLLDKKDLALHWKAENHVYLVEYLAEHGKGDAQIQAEMVQSCKAMGPAWENTAMLELTRLDEKQKKMHFVGRASKRKFEARVAALNEVVKKGDCYMQTASPQFRAVVATMISRSEFSLADEIKASPLPEGIDEAGKASLQGAMQELASPFVTQGKKFKDLSGEQLAKVADASERQQLAQRLESSKDGELYVKTPLATAKAPAKTEVHDSQTILAEATQELHKNPNSRVSLEKLKNHYASTDNSRLAAYFQGRLQQLSEEVKK
jgi:tetratricopeptide (TPR) repeat protein